MLGVQVAFVRRLDSEGVVEPDRSTGGQRRYTDAEVATVRHVSRMAGDGMTMPGIRRVLELEAEVATLKNELEQLRTHRRRPATDPPGRASTSLISTTEPGPIRDHRG
jgi:DNA-binding transcriptional MerR regulator